MLMLRLATSLSLIILFSSCKKFYDKPFQSKCKIQKIISFAMDGKDPVVATFHYTLWGAPKAILVTDRATGNPDYYFNYDQSKRLISFIAGFSSDGEVKDTSFHEYHKYIYEGDRIVADTVFVEASTSNPYVSEYFLGKYKYDKHGRIVNYTMVNSQSGDKISQDFDYSNENPNAENRSILGGDPVLMFVNRDYRKSNPALEFNNYEFPIRFEESGPRSYTWSNFLPVNEVVYDCDAHVK